MAEPSSIHNALAELRLLLGQALGEGRIDTARRDTLLDAVNEMEKLASPGNSTLLPERARK